MLLALDIGNTNIHLALYDGDTQVREWRVETHLDHGGILKDLDSVKSIIACSVVPALNDVIHNSAQKDLNITPVFINHENIDIPIHIDTPSQMGADRMVGASAAVTHYQAPCIIVDFGTSTNFDVIDKNGAHCGGVLATGARLSLSALSDAAARLPEVSIEEPAKVIGTNTKDAMQSGIYWGYIGLVEGTVAKIKAEMGENDAFVIATGGLSTLYDKGTDIFDVIDQDLIMKGLVHMHKVLKDNQPKDKS